MKATFFFIVLLISGIFNSQIKLNQSAQTSISNSIKEALVLTNAELKDTISIDALVNSNEFSLNSYELMKKLTGKYLSDITDLSYSKAYAVLDNSDGKLFLGGTFNTQPNNNSNTYFVTLGLKANVKDGFSEYFENNKLNNDIGISTKLIVNFGGTLWHNKKEKTQKDKILNNRRLLYAQKLLEIDNDLTTFKKIEKIGESETVKEFANSKSDEKTEEIIAGENDFIIENKLYNEMSLGWVSLDVYTPVTKTEYNISKDLYSSQNVENFYPFSISLTGNYWLFIPQTKNATTRFGTNKIYKGSLLFSGKADLINNNTILANKIMLFNFDQYDIYSPTVNNLMYLVKTDSKDVFVGDYERFLTPKLSAKVVYQYPFKNFSVGVRFSLEKSFGKVNNLDWKIGVPFSINDNNDNTKINFEIITQEVMNIRSTGINIGLPLNIF